MIEKFAGDVAVAYIGHLKESGIPPLEDKEDFEVQVQVVRAAGALGYWLMKKSYPSAALSDLVPRMIGASGHSGLLLRWSAGNDELFRKSLQETFDAAV